MFKCLGPISPRRRRILSQRLSLAAKDVWGHGAEEGNSRSRSRMRPSGDRGQSATPVASSPNFKRVQLDEYGRYCDRLRRLRTRWHRGRRTGRRVFPGSGEPGYPLWLWLPPSRSFLLKRPTDADSIREVAADFTRIRCYPHPRAPRMRIGHGCG